MKDLFNHIETLPKDVQNVLNEYSECEQDYIECENLLNALKPLGYTFEYYLDAVPFNLRKL
jgi:hypothetical protein